MSLAELQVLCPKEKGGLAKHQYGLRKGKSTEIHTSMSLAELQRSSNSFSRCDPISIKDQIAATACIIVMENPYGKSKKSRSISSIPDSIRFVVMAKRPPNQKELEEALNHISVSESEPFSPSESEYEPSDSEDEDEQYNLGNVDDSEEMSTDEEEEAVVEADATPAITSVLWKEPHVWKGVVTLDANRSARKIDIFLKLFPHSLFMHVAACNRYLSIKLFPHSLFMHVAACITEIITLIENHKNKRLNMKETGMYEIMIILGCTMVMCYNKVPGISDY
ncbi:hypothetical protein QE152_g27474 [Popillia japonica]|uniref:PiggyBac transposable element-derived protein domain-containing protein n=1 Tax=Popillia japonica TaxID=7064 RepID=A0AAW1JV07_POPJA